MFKKFLISILIIILLSNFVFAIGISPTHAKIALKPGETKTMTFDIIKHVGTHADFTFIGDKEVLSGFDANPKRVPIPNRDNLVTITYTYPQNLSRGGYFGTSLIIEEVRVIEGSAVGGRAAVGVPISIFLQFLGKYGDAKFDAKDAKINQPVEFDVTINNWGTENFNSASGLITVFDSQNNKLAELRTENVPVAPMETKVLKVFWDSAGYPKGNYYATANVTFDELKQNLNDTFRIGELNVTIINFTRQVYQNTIANFYVTVKNEWNDPLDNLFADVTIKNGTQTISTFTASEKTINSWETKNMKGFFNTFDIPAGNYDASISLSFNEKGSSENHHANAEGGIEVLPYTPPKQNLTANESLKQIEEPTNSYFTTTNMMLFVMLLLFLFNIIIFIIKRREEREEDENKAS